MVGPLHMYKGQILDQEYYVYMTQLFIISPYHCLFIYDLYVSEYI
jgi:hypothetical protein